MIKRYFFCFFMVTLKKNFKKKILIYKLILPKYYSCYAKFSIEFCPALLLFNFDLVSLFKLIEYGTCLLKNLGFSLCDSNYFFLNMQLLNKELFSRQNIFITKDLFFLKNLFCVSSSKIRACEQGQTVHVL